MESNSPKLNLSVHLGEDKGQALLGKVNFTNHVGDQQIKQAKVNAKIGEQEVGPALIAIIKYHVYEGREAEALKYLQQGFEQTLAADKRSPLQYITRKYNDSDVENSIYSQPGAICVRYKFPFGQQEQQDLQFLNKLEQVNKFHVDYQIKGAVSHTLKNRTNVKVDYTYFNLTAEQMLNSQLVNSLLIESQLIPQQVVSNAFYTTALKSRKMHLALRFKSFRQINKYYEQFKKMWDYDFKQKHESKKDFKYMAPGLFREKVQAFAFLKDSVAVSAEVTHQGEDIFFRLVKVYFKAIKALID